MRRLVLNMVCRPLVRSENICKNFTLLPTRTFSSCSDQKPAPKRPGRTRYITRRRVISSVPGEKIPRLIYVLYIGMIGMLAGVSVYNYWEEDKYNRKCQQDYDDLYRPKHYEPPK